MKATQPQPRSGESMQPTAQAVGSQVKHSASPEGAKEILRPRTKAQVQMRS